MSTHKISTPRKKHDPAIAPRSESQARDQHGAARTPTDPTTGQPVNYTPYGFRNANAKPTGAEGFNGEFYISALNGYALGNGYRIFIPRLMRFISPDNQSPFLKGVINAYAYCLNDPVNAQDPSGKNAINTLVQTAIKIGKTYSKRFKPSNTGHLLSNNQAKHLKIELKDAKSFISKGIVDINIINDNNSAKKISPSLIYKYTLINEGDETTLVVFGASTDALLNTHASGAEMWNFNASNNVSAAGYIAYEKGVFIVDDWSGHYQPEPWRMALVKAYLEGLGYEVRTVRRGFG
ncbi:RHS repeat-associated core domain-containing protein [Pseudomonas putida]|uniref:RHS repeat-associated core domain-containing protein n=1 Tax=Pseudomonas putida TaxID=303 RepID=UPI00210BEA4C|nr:RHS repeat-associated core domain-containing protein [Pseudomonas putida]